MFDQGPRWPCATVGLSRGITAAPLSGPARVGSRTGPDIGRTIKASTHLSASYSDTVDSDGAFDLWPVIAAVAANFVF